MSPGHPLFAGGPTKPEPTRLSAAHGLAPHKEIRHMAEDTFTLTTFYTSWKAYQDHIKGALAPP